MDIAELKAQLTRDEGLKLKPYLDTTGHWTIGVGRNLTTVGISAVESDFMLTNDIQRVQMDLNRALPWWIGLSDNRQLVLANLTFNIGINGVLGFKNMLAACQSGDFKTASEQMLVSRWAEQVGDRAQRLALLMEKG